ncbi:MAG: rhodanese-like domain-containing protein [Actinobacteria bacterium]|nr:rhodanese-like domain-containing protein [Actinomycetota bacterium]
MIRTKWLVVAVAAALVVGAVVLGPSGSRGGVVDSADLQSLIADGVRVVDVRTVGEFDSGHIPGAENVPVNELAGAAVAWDPAEPVALYCATGSRSAEGAGTLRSMGFAIVYDLGAGIAGWTGEVEGGTSAAVAAEPSAGGLPVMYEFYTEW